MPDFTTKLNKKKCAACRLYLYIFWNRFCRQSTSGSCLILLQKFKKEMGSVPPVPLCFLEPVLQAEYQRISDCVYFY